MCLAYPGKIIKIKQDLAIVDYQIEQRTAKLISEDFRIGDYVIVQAGIVVERVPEEKALDALAAYNR